MVVLVVAAVGVRVKAKGRVRQRSNHPEQCLDNQLEAPLTCSPVSVVTSHVTYSMIMGP